MQMSPRLAAGWILAKIVKHSGCIAFPTNLFL
jgi:hypothetical protein